MQLPKAKQYNKSTAHKKLKQLKRKSLSFTKEQQLLNLSKLQTVEKKYWKKTKH